MKIRNPRKKHKISYFLIFTFLILHRRVETIEDAQSVQDECLKENVSSKNKVSWDLNISKHEISRPFRVYPWKFRTSLKGSRRDKIPKGEFVFREQKIRADRIRISLTFFQHRIFFNWYANNANLKEEYFSLCDKRSGKVE